MIDPNHLHSVLKGIDFYSKPATRINQVGITKSLRGEIMRKSHLLGAVCAMALAASVSQAQTIK